MDGTYPFFLVEKVPAKQTAVVYLNRPEKLNAMNWSFWSDLPLVINDLEKDPEVRVVIIAGKGRAFSVGLDVYDFFTRFQDILEGKSPEKREDLYKLILQMQEGFNRIAYGENIYIAAVHGYCIGGGLDLIAACDLRLATRDAIFSLRETRIAIVADMGSLNRLPKIIGQGNTRMMAFTGRDFSAEEVRLMGLLNGLYDNREELMREACYLAMEIASNTREAVMGAKHILNYMDDHGVLDGMKYVASWNAAFLNLQKIREVLAKKG
ncbi:MAG: enoyl-CoA hydratase-related protein [Syntrophales bacterium]|nr:enoyl-CoA hydratase-related protein [Syntrophales bacterium]